LSQIRRDTLEDQVFRILRSEILDGTLPPGALLVQGELAARLGTSRLPVRDALKRLAAEGFVEGDSGRSFRVVEQTLDELQEIYEIRGLLEPLAAARSVPHLSDAEIQALEETVQEMQRAMRDGRNEDYVELNYRFHMTLYRASGAKRLVRLIESFWLGLPPLTPMAVRGQIASSNRDHSEILKWVKRRDPEKVKAAIAAHIATSESNLVRQLKQRKKAHLERESVAVPGKRVLASKN